MLCVFRFAPLSLFELCFYSALLLFTLRDDDATLLPAAAASQSASLSSLSLFAILLLGRSVTTMLQVFWGRQPGCKGMTHRTQLWLPEMNIGVGCRLPHAPCPTCPMLQLLRVARQLNNVVAPPNTQKKLISFFFFSFRSFIRCVLFHYPHLSLPHTHTQFFHFSSIFSIATRCFVLHEFFFIFFFLGSIFFCS